MENFTFCAAPVKYETWHEHDKMLEFNMDIAASVGDLLDKSQLWEGKGRNFMVLGYFFFFFFDLLYLFALSIR